MTLRNPSRRVTKRHQGIVFPHSLSVRTKSELFALMLLPRAVTLGLNLTGPTTIAPLVDVRETVTMHTNVIFDTKVAVGPLAIATPLPRIEVRSSRAEDAAAQRAAVAAAQQTRLLQSTSNALTAPSLPEPNLDAKRALVQQIAADQGISWKLLEAVWQIESGKAWHTTVTSSAGARGPMQFMLGTWRGYGTGDISSAPDALRAGAKLLAANGAASGDEHRALFSYNHAEWYVHQVQSIMKSIE